MVFRQAIENGYQVEYPDNWLRDIHVWEIRRPEEAVEVPFMVILKLRWITMAAYKFRIKMLNM